MDNMEICIRKFLECVLNNLLPLSSRIIGDNLKWTSMFDSMSLTVNVSTPLQYVYCLAPILHPQIFACTLLVMSNTSVRLPITHFNFHRYFLSLAYILSGMYLNPKYFQPASVWAKRGGINETELHMLITKTYESFKSYLIITPNDHKAFYIRQCFTPQHKNLFLNKFPQYQLQRAFHLSGSEQKSIHTNVFIDGSEKSLSSSFLLPSHPDDQLNNNNSNIVSTIECICGCGTDIHVRAEIFAFIDGLLPDQQRIAIINNNHNHYNNDIPSIVKKSLCMFCPIKIIDLVIDFTLDIPAINNGHPSILHLLKNKQLNVKIPFQ